MKLYNNIIIGGLLAISSVLASCNYDEDALEPSNERSSYTINQGNHDYDKTIQEFYNKYGKYLLYKFSEKDVYWTPTAWANGQLSTDSTTSGKQGYLVESADTKYVGQQLGLLNEVWFSKLSDEAKKELLPTKIMLCSSVNDVVLQWVWGATVTQKYVPVPIYAKYNYDNISVSGGSAEAAAWTDTEKDAFRKGIMQEWASYIAEHKATYSDEFGSSVDYSSDAVKNASGPAACCEVGILNNPWSATATTDWTMFIVMMTTYPESYLTEDPGDLSNWYDWTQYDYNIGSSVYDYDTNFHGILNSAKDKNGIIQKRYDIVRKYFKDTYGIDLQEIGNKNN